MIKMPELIPDVLTLSQKFARSPGSSIESIRSPKPPAVSMTLRVRRSSSCACSNFLRACSKAAKQKPLAHTVAPSLRTLGHSSATTPGEFHSPRYFTLSTPRTMLRTSEAPVLETLPAILNLSSRRHLGDFEFGSHPSTDSMQPTKLNISPRQTFQTVVLTALRSWQTVSRGGD